MKMNNVYQLVQVKTLEDWESLHSLRQSELFSSTKGIVYNRSHPHDYDPSNFPLVLKLDGTCIGTARVDLFGEDSAAIRLVAIDKAFQGRGHGRELEQLCERLAKKKGANTLHVNAIPTAVGYYEKLGFIRDYWDDPTGSRTGIARDCIPMSKNL